MSKFELVAETYIYGSVTTTMKNLYLDVDAPALLNESSYFTLRTIASELFSNTVQPPQAAIDLLNREFWNLV